MKDHSGINTINPQTRNYLQGAQSLEQSDCFYDQLIQKQTLYRDVVEANGAKLDYSKQYFQGEKRSSNAQKKSFMLQSPHNVLMNAKRQARKQSVPIQVQIAKEGLKFTANYKRGSPYNMNQRLKSLQNQTSLNLPN